MKLIIVIYCWPGLLIGQLTSCSEQITIKYIAWFVLLILIHWIAIYYYSLENNPQKNTCDRNTKLARAVDVMMVRAKRINILMIKVDFLFCVAVFLKEIENMFFVFLSSYRNTHESLGELDNAMETLACGSCSHSISCSPKLSLVFL